MEIRCAVGPEWELLARTSDRAVDPHPRLHRHNESVKVHMKINIGLKFIISRDNSVSSRRKHEKMKICIDGLKMPLYLVFSLVL